MANVDTPYDGADGIIIRTDPAKNPTFHLTVKEQLDLIGSEKVGKALLKKIHDSKVKQFGYKVCIMRADSSGTMGNDGLIKWHGSNVTTASNENEARGGKGSVSAIKYNPNVTKTPDGDRPPYIGLAHELIHAMHNLYGTSERETVEDESKVVGFGKYQNEPITENKIRKEHGLKPRETYKGVVESKK
jgi:hypothetical protein